MESRYGPSSPNLSILRVECRLITNLFSPMWGYVVHHYPALCNVSRWIIGKGTRRFWMDNWLGEIIPGPQPVDANLSIADGLGYSNTLSC